MLTRLLTSLLLGIVVFVGSSSAAEYNQKVTTSDIRLGKVIMGKLDKKDLDGRVVLVEFWGINCGYCMISLPKIAALHRELSPFGLVVVGAHRQPAPPSLIVSRASSRGVNFPIVTDTRVEGGMDFTGIPHVILFDHTGKCVFRGHPNRVESALREAVMAGLADTASKNAPGATVAQLVLSLRQGTPLPNVLRQTLPLLKSDDKDVASDAKKFIDVLTVGGKKQVEEAEALQTKDPVKAYDLVYSAALVYQGTPVGIKATKLLRDLKEDPGVRTELQARPVLEAIRRLDSTLWTRSEEKKQSPKSEDFLKANGFYVKQLEQKLRQIRKIAPKSLATTEAVSIAEKYGLGKEKE